MDNFRTLEKKVAALENQIEELMAGTVMREDLSKIEERLEKLEKIINQK